MGILSVYIFWEWSDRIFQEIMVEVREKFDWSIKPSINEQLTEISSSEESILTVPTKREKNFFFPVNLLNTKRISLKPGQFCRQMVKIL